MEMIVSLTLLAEKAAFIHIYLSALHVLSLTLRHYACQDNQAVSEAQLFSDTLPSSNRRRIILNFLFIMADPLSIAASSFAVVGAVDVVLRVSVECGRFLSEIKDAPAEIDALRIYIAENRQLVETLKKRLEELKISPILPTANLASAFAMFTSSVRALQRELNALQMLAKKYSRIDKTWTKLKWVLDARKTIKSIEKLERSKSTLSVALSLVEGSVNLLHSSIGLFYINKGVICRKRSGLTQTQLENVIQQSIQPMTSKIDNQLQDLSAVRKA